MCNMNEEDVADLLFSLNKKAKNMRDKQKNMIYTKAHKMTKSNKSKISAQIQDAKEKKNSYYEQKDLILDTYFEPISIHKERLTTKEYEHISNMSGVNLEKLMTMTLTNRFAFNFLEEKYQKNPKTVKFQNIPTKTKCYCFNGLIEDDSIIEAICDEIKETYPLVIVKGRKLYLPYRIKINLDDIFMKHLWNGQRLFIPKKYERVLTFGKIDIARKTNTVNSEYRYYLFYRVDNHSFHRPIEKEELTKYPNLKIVDVSLHTKGESDETLIKDRDIQHIMRNLKEG